MRDEEQELKEQIKFGALGQQVVNNAAYQSAMTTRKAHLFDVFSNTSQDQSDIREEAWRTMQNLKALEDYFENILTSGKLSDEQLRQYEQFRN